MSSPNFFGTSLVYTKNRIFEFAHCQLDTKMSVRVCGRTTEGHKLDAGDDDLVLVCMLAQ